MPTTAIPPPRLAGFTVLSAPVDAAGQPLAIYSSDPPGLPLTRTAANQGQREGHRPLATTDLRTPTHPRVRITFTTSGTDHFQCLIDPGMDRTITVTRYTRPRH